MWGSRDASILNSSSLTMEIALFLHGLSHLAWPTFPDSGRGIRKPDKGDFFE